MTQLVVQYIYSVIYIPPDLNVMDWSMQDMLAIALGGVVYLLNIENGDSSSLCNTGSENIYISSVRWNKSGKYLAVGTSNAEVQVLINKPVTFLCDQEKVISQGSTRLSMLLLYAGIV